MAGSSLSAVDTAFVLPGTNIRYGIEAILRLIPGVGDVAASALSAFLLYQAYRLGVPRHLFVRMLANVAMEGIVGSVPFLGDAFDVAFRANRRTSGCCESISSALASSKLTGCRFSAPPVPPVIVKAGFHCARRPRRLRANGKATGTRDPGPPK